MRYLLVFLEESNAATNNSFNFRKFLLTYGKVTCTNQGQKTGNSVEKFASTTKKKFPRRSKQDSYGAVLYLYILPCMTYSKLSALLGPVSRGLQSPWSANPSSLQPVY